ncbi:4-diphosphocytidyl-2-C-methyl-D-erythritol kinase-like [Saccostrea echinata]|uniref:4-diphosphocytidyl-2-C-methyl-D-erythritol kinase-like n=1 Tax=Saccostrea echinata TaxID=191078 RepID=UPI002A7F214F|nr:4-diphosphocytidyl-2-C-methyl-D-erythritol kinase-like [Saccostrea echinata]
MRLENLYDEVKFISSVQSDFVLEGNFSCTREENTIYRSYLSLLERNLKCDQIKEFFRKFKVVVDKKIPEFGGLGGGSSNAATFLQMANESCRLGLSTDELCQIGETIGADVPFFLYDVDCANVMGIGEKVEPINEKALDLKYNTPNIKCNTGQVYRNFREKHYKELSLEKYEELKTISSREFLETFDAYVANDLCESTLELYPDMKQHVRQGWFLTGSGSTVFALNG